LALKKAESRKVVLYTLSDGPLAAYHVHLYCESCKISYHHNFSVSQADDRLEHKFVERKVIDLWINMMLVLTSAINCARLYNLSIGQDSGPLLAGWPTYTLSSDHVWDAFIILSLLEDHQTQKSILCVPHGGGIWLYGHDKLHHVCDKCSHIFTDKDGNSRFYFVVVIDGISIGCPCCGKHNCHLPLPNNRHHFCATHEELNNQCAIVGCEEPVADRGPGLPKAFTCPNPEHQEIEQARTEKGQAHFVLKERLLQQRICAQFGRRRSHNKQIFVAPCGTIIARETFFGAEAISSIAEMIVRTYHINDLMPNHIFFDNNCTLGKFVQSNPIFQRVCLTVDIFHFACGHSESDTFCQQNCNPHAYPELLREDGQ
ncbi:hypothetical protein FIBSPDRAFT_727349, partial [Athelia psychrophila]